MALPLRLITPVTVLSVLCGIAGSLLFNWACAPFVYAQGPSRSIERVIAAEKFVLVDQSGHVVGTFSIDRKGKPNIVLTKDGQVIWTALPDSLIRPAK